MAPGEARIDPITGSIVPVLAKKSRDYSTDVYYCTNCQYLFYRSVKPHADGYHSDSIDLCQKCAENLPK